MQMALKPLLDKAREQDLDFDFEVVTKESRTEKPKSFAECCEFILGEAYEYAKEHKDGNTAVAGMSDDDMMSLIKHYYDEDDIVIKKMGGNVTAEVAGTSAPVKKEETAEEKKAREEREKQAKEAREKAEAEQKAKDEEKAKREAEKAKKLAEAEMKKGNDCYSLFS